MPKTDRCIVRNEAYQRGEFNIRERHNERKNEHYFNGNVTPELSHLNVHFKRCEGTYEQTFERMVEDGAISLRGLKSDAKVFDELMFAVNTDYFDRNGGYEYAKQFFEEAYRLAVKEIGGEQYILSAVMHADEKNKARSAELGRDVFQYHLHVVYVPVVDKEIKWTKRCKDPALVGTVKEVVRQVSHSKKWPGRVYKLDEDGQQILTKNGNPSWVNSYSLLQDRFYEHMRETGFTDFERGERGSTAEHLDVLDYQIQQDKKRLAALDEAIESKENVAATLDKKVEKREEQLSGLQEKITSTKKEAAALDDIDRKAKKTIGGNYQLTPADWKTVSGLAKEGVKSRGIIAGLKKQIADFVNRVNELTQRLKKYEGLGVTDTMRYYEAMQRAPRRLAETIADIKRQPPEHAPERKAPERKRGHGLEI